MALKKSSLIVVNDIFDELKDENQRFLNELLFADKCLNVLIEYKTFVEMIFTKYSQHFESQEVDYYQQNLIKSVEEVLNIDNYRQLNQMVNKTDDKASNQSDPRFAAKKPLSDEKTETYSSESAKGDNIRVIKPKLAPKTTSEAKSVLQSVDKLKRKYIKVGINSKNSVIENKERVKKINVLKRSTVKTRHGSQSIENCDKPKRIRTKSLITENLRHLKNLCNFCGQELSSTEEMSIHSDIHSKMYIKGPRHNGNYQYICQYPDCKYRVIGIDAFIAHINGHKRLKPFQCPTCDQRFPSKSRLYVHCQTHSGKEFGCHWPGCEYRTPVRNHLYCHLQNVHSTERKFVCDWPECGKRFKRRPILILHLKMHRGDKRHACHWPGCQFRAISVTQLKSHMRSHSDIRNYGCDWPECGKRFKCLHHLRVHQRMHTNDKPYVCPHPGCDHRCTHSGNLKSHMRVHSK